MIGLGKWACHVDTMFFKGDVEMTISDNNGQYGFDLKLPGIDIPGYEIKELNEENGDTINAIVNVDMLPGKDISLILTFTDDTVNGLVKVPFLGKIKLKDGKKIG